MRQLFFICQYPNFKQKIVNPHDAALEDGMGADIGQNVKVTNPRRANGVPGVKQMSVTGALSPGIRVSVAN